MIQFSQTILGPLSNNVYLAVDEKTGEGLVVDPTAYTEDIKETLLAMGMKKLKYILLTHGHYDHIFGVPELKAQFPEAQVVISHIDSACLSDARLSLAAKHGIDQKPVKADIEVYNANSLDFGETKILVMETPGHTKGSVVYLLDEVMFSGDTLFAGSIGRTDFETSDPEAMKKSIAKLKAIPQNYIVLPGHGPLTILDIEKKTNPYFKEEA